MSGVATSRIARIGGDLPASYWKLWAASAASNVADGVFWIAMPLLAIQLTDSPALVAGITVASRLPWLLFALVAGALADRLDRRRTMLLVDVVRAGVVGALTLTVLSGSATILMLYAVVFLLGVFETLFDTAAQSIMPSLVDRDLLSRANGRLYAVELTMNQFVGPPIGGFLAALGLAYAFGLPALAYVVAALFLLTIAGSFRPVREGPQRHILREIGEGLGYLLRHPVLRVLAFMVGVSNLGGAATMAILVVYAVAPGPLGLDEIGFGVLMTGFAFGSLAGSFLVERMERRLGRANLLALAMATFAVMTAVPAFTTSALVVGISFVVGGLMSVVWNVVTVSLRQRIVPDRLLGRVNASYRLLAWGTMPIGAALGGVIAELAGIRAVFLVAGVVTAMLVLCRLVVTDAAIAAAEIRDTGGRGAQKDVVEVPADAG